MATIKFIIRKATNPAPIYLRMSLSKTQSLKRKTGLVVDPKNWDPKKGLISSARDAKDKPINPALKKLEGHVLERLNADNSTGVEINGDWLENVIETGLSSSR